MDTGNIYQLIGQAVDSIFTGTTIVDPDGIFVYVSPSCCQFFKIQQEDLLGHSVREQSVLEIFQPCVSAIALQSWKETAMTQKNRDGQSTLVTSSPLIRDGRILMVITTSSWGVSSVEELQQKYMQLQNTNEQLQNEILRLKKKERVGEDVPGRSASLTRTLHMLEIFHDNNLPAYVYGEEGTGRRFLVEKVYGGSIVGETVDCALFDDAMLEKELFYRSWSNDPLSKYRIVQNPDCLHPIMQKKLLDHLQTGHLRILCVADISLEQAVKERKMIGDLAQYFLSYQVHVPSLSERKEDIWLYVEYFLNLYNKKYMRSISFTARAKAALIAWKWPGNIHEVRHTIERIVLTSQSERVDIYQLPAEFCRQSEENYSPSNSLRDMMEFYEAGIITQAYQQYRTTTRVARELGISQPSAARKIQKYVRNGKKCSV